MTITNEWDRFKGHLSEPDDEGCVLWKSTIQPNTGYAKFAVVREKGEKAAMVSAARWLWQRAFGDIHPDLTIEHYCHTSSINCPGGIDCKHRRCVNIDHLALITRGRNAALGHLRRQQLWV